MLSIKELNKLDGRSAREKHGVMVIEGQKVIDEAIKAGLVVQQLLATRRALGAYGAWITPLRAKLQITDIADHSAQRLANTATPSGLFAVVELPKPNWENFLTLPKLVAIDGVKDPGNLGTMLRTASWFGVKGVLLSRTGVDPYNSKVIRATMGSLFHQQLWVTDDLSDELTQLKEAGFQIIVTRPEGKPAPVEPAAKWCVVMGNESVGTSAEVDELADTTFTIPSFGKDTESLNVSVSFGIALHELTRV